MTSEERSRAKKLERLSLAYEKPFISRSAVMTAAIIFVALLYLLWYFLGVSEYIPSAHACFAVMIMFLYSNDNVGDGGAPNGSDIGLPITGSSGTGAFFCTLPFEAKDVLRMRLRRFEIQLAIINIITVITQILPILMYGGAPLQWGFCTALLLLAELLYMAAIFIRHYQIKLYTNIIISLVFVILSCSAFAPATDLYNDVFPLMNVFEFLSGLSGIVALIIFPILILTVGEIYLKNKKDPSWNLR